MKLLQYAECYPCIDDCGGRIDRHDWCLKVTPHRVATVHRSTGRALIVYDRRAAEDSHDLARLYGFGRHAVQS